MLLPSPLFIKTILLFSLYVNFAVVRFRALQEKHRLPLIGRGNQSAPVVKSLGHALLAQDGHMVDSHQPLSVSYQIPISKALSYSPGELLRQLRVLLLILFIAIVPALVYTYFPPNFTVEAWLVCSSLYLILLLLVSGALTTRMNVTATLTLDDGYCAYEERFLFLSAKWQYKKNNLVSISEDYEYLIVETEEERTRFPGPPENEPRLSSRLLKNHSIFLDDSPFQCLAYERASDGDDKTDGKKEALYVPRTLTIKVGKRKLELSVMKRSQLPPTIRDEIEPLFALDPATKNSRPFDAVVVLKGNKLKVGENWYISFRDTPLVVLQSQGWKEGPIKGCCFKRPESEEQLPPPLASALIEALGNLQEKLKRGVLAIGPSRVLFVHPGTNVPANVLGPIFNSMTSLLDIDFSVPLQSHHIEILDLKEVAVDAALCQVCGELVKLEAAKCCPRCDTAHHHDCWEYMGGCSIYGCGN